MGDIPRYMGDIPGQILKNFAIHEYNFLYKKKWCYTMPSSKKSAGFASFFLKNQQIYALINSYYFV